MSVLSKPIRWKMLQIVREFGIDNKTWAKRLRASEVIPGADGAFSTRDVVRVVFGDLDAERLRLTREQADKIALENQEQRRQLIHVDELSEFVGKFLSSAKARIQGNQKLEPEEKDRIIETIGRCVPGLESGLSDAGAEDAGDPDAAAEVHGKPVE